MGLEKIPKPAFIGSLAGYNMIRYSHVSLFVHCKTRSEADLVTEHLGIQPSQVREDKYQQWSKERGQSEMVSYAWVLDSPKSAEQADPTGRLMALADVIEPFGERLLSLNSEFRRFVDIVYHVTPQHPDGITGEFDWFRMPAVLMRRVATWNLDVSFETFWFDHPDWVSPARRSWWKRVSQSLRKHRT
jgi:hypothetical protein